jgi:ribosomal protein S18 acetylase RimI-like enzyme
MNDITIKAATVEDIGVIQSIIYQTYPATYKDILSAQQITYMIDLLYSTAMLQKQIEQEHHTYLIATKKETAIAFAAFSMVEENIYKLHKIYALPSQQGKGLGKLLINFVTEEIKKAGATAIRLNVNRHNKAKSFYEHLGFAVIYEEDIDIGNGYFMNDYVMDKKI